MTISPLLIYVWQLFHIIEIIGVISFLVALFSLIFFLGTISDSGEYEKVSKKLKIIFISSFIFWFVLMFVPSSNTIAMMYVIPKIADSKVIQTDVPELYETAKKALIEKLKN